MVAAVLIIKNILCHSVLCVLPCCCVVIQAACRATLKARQACLKTPRRTFGCRLLLLDLCLLRAPLLLRVVQTTRRATLKASHKAIGLINSKQDVKFTIGLDLDWPQNAKEPKAVRWGDWG